MKKLILMLFVFICFTQLNSIVEESADLFNFFFSSEPNCAYSKWESHIVEGIAQEGYNMYAPYDRQTDGFGQFTLPSDEQTDAWEEAVDYFFAAQYTQAQTVFTQNSIPYTVVKFTDGQDIYYMLRENLNNSYTDDNGTTPIYDDEVGSFDFGWGIYIYRSTEANPIVVTAPHPNDDFVSPYIAVNSFLDFEGQYLMINGSGREVVWSEYGGYSNGKSLSDPTRNSNHPFNYFYKKACDKIREDYDRRELSVQLHSYDWDSHPNRESCQISPGQYRRPAGLPIRDFSSLREDVIQNTDYIVIPQGTIGNNEQVTVREYYSVHNYFYDTVYQDTVIISDRVDLPGYPSSFHDNYTTDNYSDWDVFSPFFHVEFDELPNCYEQDEDLFKWFYGFNSYTNTWNIPQKYTKLAQYYEPFMEALGSSIDSWVEFDDGDIPEAPTNLRRSYGGSGNVIAWDESPCYDFYTYEILYSLNPISQGNYSVLNRNDNERLGFPIMDSMSILDLQLNQSYYMAMRTVDYNGNISPISEEIIFTTLPITTSEFEIFADNSSIDIEWTMTQQQNCAGFEVYRSQDNSEFELYSSYTNNSGLDITSSTYQMYEFTDTNVDLEHNYAYRINVVNNQSQSSQISQVMNGSLANYINLTATSQYWDKTVTFGKSYFATEAYDETYDVVSTVSNTYFALAYNNQEFIRNIVSDFNPNHGVSYLDLIIDNPPTSLTFTIDTSRYSERFYLEFNNEIYSLDSQAVELSFPENGNYDARLIWGNLQPQVMFSDLESSLIYQGDEVELVWSLDYPELVASTDLYFIHDQGMIPIAEELPPGQTSYTFTNDFDQNYRMLNLYVVVTSTDNQTLEFKSHSRFVLVSDIPPLNLEQTSANQLFAYPFIDDFALAPYAGSIEAFSFSNEEFNDAEVINSNNGYLLNIIEDCLFEYPGIPFLENEQYMLTRGWNLIHNPHPVDYPIHDILFDRNGIVRSFKSIQNSGMIVPNVVGVRDGSYVSVDTLKALESAFLYQITNDVLYIRFDPVNQSVDFNLQEAELFFTVEFKSTSGAKDEVTVGIQSGLTPVIDFYYDLMEPPMRPTYGIKEAYIIPEIPLVNYYPKMNTKMQEATAEEEYSWNIAFTNTLEEAVQVRIKASNNSDNYPLYLSLAGETYALSEDYLTLANSEQGGTFFAELTMMTVTDNDDNDIQALSEFIVSPNPISKQATIRVKNSKNTNYSLSIYNLRGQKVKDFNSKDFKTDKSNFLWNLTNNNGKRVSSGIYFVRYKDESKTQTKKICVIK